MAANVKNLDWIRKLDIPNVPAAGARLFEMMNSIKTHLETLEQQTNSNLSGTTGPPPAIQALHVIPHPQGVDISIQHDGEFYAGMHYLIDHADNPHFRDARTQDIGSSRNHIFPVGEWSGYYQVRAKYPSGQSTAPMAFGGPVPRIVHGGSVTQVTLLPTQGAGTTKPGQPPGFGGAFTSQNGAPPLRRLKQ